MSTPVTLESTIDTAADEIRKELTQCLDEDLQDRVDNWCEQQGLERLDEPLDIVARQAAFNVLLKVTLYDQYHQRGVLPELDSCEREALRTAEETTGDPAFSEYTLDEVAWLADPLELSDVISARDKLETEDDPAEEIGRLFEALTPQESRRKLGQFRTPRRLLI